MTRPHFELIAFYFNLKTSRLMLSYRNTETNGTLTTEGDIHEFEQFNVYRTEDGRWGFQIDYHIPGERYR